MILGDGAVSTVYFALEKFDMIYLLDFPACDIKAGYDKKGLVMPLSL